MRNNQGVEHHRKENSTMQGKAATSYFRFYPSWEKLGKGRNNKGNKGISREMKESISQIFQSFVSNKKIEGIRAKDKGLQEKAEELVLKFYRDCSHIKIWAAGKKYLKLTCIIKKYIGCTKYKKALRQGCGKINFIKMLEFRAYPYQTEESCPRAFLFCIRNY